MKKQFLLLLGVIFIPIVLVAQTNISGTISNNTTLTAANSPYIVTGHINVNSGVTLTVESGVEMKFNSGIYIQVFGTLIANSATFTANESTTKGFWPGIYVSYEYSSDIGNVTLNNCIVEYAQSLRVRKGELNLTNNTTINNFSSYGVDVYTAGTLNIDHTVIQNCTYPVYFRDNGGNGKWTAGEGVVLTANDNDYIFIDFRDVNTDFTCYSLGIPYYYNSELRITGTGTLVVEPGDSILGNTGSYITVYGKIKANGTVTEPVVFSNEPSSAYWQGLNFYDEAIDTACVLSNCKFTGANYVYSNSRNYELSRCVVQVINSSPTFDSCEFSNNRYNLVVTGSSFPSFSNCEFKASNFVSKQSLNLNIDLNATPAFSNCSVEFNASEARAIGIIGSTVYHDAHMKQQSFINLDSITYTLCGNVIIQDTASLIIDPGIVIKCTNSSYYIQANGALNAIGTETEPIVFTHIADDNYGNPYDTYNDGTSSITRSSSGRLILNGPAASNVEYWKILYAGLNSSYYAVYVYNNSILKNCEINESYRGIIFSGNAQLLNNSIQNISYYPLSRIMNDGSPVLIGNTGSNIGNLGIYVHSFGSGTYSVGGLGFAGNSNVAYIIDNNREISTSTDLTIEPGTVFKFVNGSSKLTVRGGLKAEGTKNNKVIFTSIYDNSASGNTNFNGGADPTGYKWSGIEFTESSHDNFNILKNSEIRYIYNSLIMRSCKIVMDSVLLNFCNTYGLAIYGNANPVISNCEFNNLGNAPIKMDMFANPTFSGNSIANVPKIGISLNGGTVSGTVPVRSFAGYDSITYLIDETMRVDDQLTIPAGLTFKGISSYYWDIYGTFNVEGTDDEPVVFTSLHDDAYGNPRDTEQNGQGAISKTGIRLVFRAESDDNSIVNNALFRYSYTYSVYNGDASPTIKNSRFYKTNDWGIYLYGTSAPVVDSCSFHDVRFPLAASLMAFPGSNSGNILSGTTGKGIHVRDNETLTQNFTLPIRSFAGIENIPYIFDRYTVGTSAVLTIAPGVVCKFRRYGYLNVRNGLIADGGSTPDSVIVFTSDRDDFYGGDVYSDGDANLADNNWWAGISFPEESIDASCFFDNCVIKNASRVYSNSVYSYNRGSITLDNSSPTIQNCLFDHNYWGILVRNTSLPAITNCDFVAVHPTYGYAIWNETGSATVNAENCWWNDASGPYNLSLNPDGLGERVSDGVDFTPWISQTSQPIMGDVSLNGEVMPYDASLVLQSAVGNITLDTKQQAVADVSDDGTISSFDASLILQYTIGMIPNFEPSGKKSVSELNEVSITISSDFISPASTRFEVPLSLSSFGSVKSIDMDLSSNNQHLRFVGLNSDRLPGDIMIASGYQEATGILKISLASAQDLDLNFDELGLVFEFIESPLEESEIELISVRANEKQEDESFTIIVQSQDALTGIPSASALSSFNLYNIDDLFIADFHLVKKQSRLIFSVHDINGKLTNQKIIEYPEVGLNHFSFNAEENGERNSFKIYLVTIRGDDFVMTRKLVLR